MSTVVIDTTGLKFLRGSEMNVIIRKAMNTASAPSKAAAVQNAPSMTGTLKKSMRIRNRYYFKTKSWVSVVGVSSSFQRSGGRGKVARRRIYRKTGVVFTDEVVKAVIRPGKYAKALENRRPYLKPAYFQTRHLFASILTSSIRVQLALQMPKS